MSSRREQTTDKATKPLLYASHPLTIPSLSSQTTTFQVDSSAVNIVYLEHVVVNMTLNMEGYGRGYDIRNVEAEYNYASNDEEFYQWLEDPHPRRGDIKIELTSPQGTVSTLLPYRDYDFVNKEGYTSWPFMSVQHWGENPTGTWSLRVTFQSSSARVIASGVSMILHGTPTVPSSVSAIPESCDPACASKCSGPASSDCDACKQYRVASDLECVSTCPNATYVHNKYCLSGPYQPDHKITYPGSKRTVYIASGAAALFLLLVIVLVVVCVVIACRRSRRTRSRKFVYSPISATTV